MGFMKNVIGRAKKPFILMELMNDPEKFELNMYVENDEIVVKVRKRKKDQPVKDDISADAETESE